MEPDNPNSQALKIIREITSLIDNAGKDPEKMEKVLGIVGKYVLKDHLGIILAMHHNGSLLRLLRQTCDVYFKKKNKQILQTVYMIKQLALDGFFFRDDLYLKTLKAYGTRFLTDKKYADLMDKQARETYLWYYNLIRQFIKIKYDQNCQTFEKGKNINQYISSKLPADTKVSGFTEIIITWLRKEIMEFQRQIYKQKGHKNIGFCCHLHFEENQAIQDLNFGNHSYVNLGPAKLFIAKAEKGEYALGQSNNIKKAIVYYLNNKGGFLFYGFKEGNKLRPDTIQGIEIPDQEYKLQFLNALQAEIVTKIYPTDQQDQNQDQEQQKIRLRDFRELKKSQFSTFRTKLKWELSKYLSIDFLNIYNKQTLFFSRDNKGALLYVIRIYVKAGDISEVYFFLNQKQQPEAFMLESKSLSMIEYYDMVYEKLKNKANGKEQMKQLQSHYLCRFTFKAIEPEPQPQPEEE